MAVWVCLIYQILSDPDNRVLFRPDRLRMNKYGYRYEFQRRFKFDIIIIKTLNFWLFNCDIFFVSIHTRVSRCFKTWICFEFIFPYPNNFLLFKSPQFLLHKKKQEELQFLFLFRKNTFRVYIYHYIRDSSQTWARNKYILNWTIE